MITQGEEDRNFIFTSEHQHHHRVARVADDDKEVKVRIEVNGITITALIDSGCPVTIINNDAYAYLLQKGFVEKDYSAGCDVPFHGYEINRPAIVIKGSCIAKLSFEGKHTEDRIYIAPYGRENLLGKKTAERLGLLKVGPSVYDVKLSKEFPKIKNCLIDITIDRSVTPTVVKYRRMPLEIESKIHVEVHKLLEAGIIEPVPTDQITWVSRMIAIPKGNEGYRLVVDMRMPNTAVKSEFYPQPSVEEALMLPPVAKLSKIDLKKGFHLCELNPKCRDITAFATKEGVFRFKRLMFGLKSAPEIFNRELDKIFLNHKGISKYCDDFLIYGRTQDEHDVNLQAVLKTIREANLEINQEKSVYDVTEVSFLGHIVTTRGTLPDPDKVNDIKSFRAPESKDELQTLLGRFLNSNEANVLPIYGLFQV